MRTPARSGVERPFIALKEASGPVSVMEPTDAEGVQELLSHRLNQIYILILVTVYRMSRLVFR